MTTTLDAALEYARRGDPVFPVWHAEGARCGCRALDCENPGKHPIASCAPNGLENATTDESIVGRWWARFPAANIATRTGVTRTVLDVDPRAGGRESLARLEAQHGPLPVTARVLTGGGGEHYHFAPVPGLKNSAGKIAPGLDIRGVGGYVLLPPSDHVSGGTYLDDLMAPLYETPLATMPAWLVALAMAEPATSGNGQQRTPDEWAAKLTGAPEGQRRAVALEIAGHYLGLRIAPEEVQSILLGYAARCVPPFPEREAREIVRDLARRDRARQRPAAEEARPASAASDGPVLVQLSTVAAEAVEWEWVNRIPRGKLALLIGEPGDGKSQITTDVVARTSRGAEWPDGGRAPDGAAIILAAEDGMADTMRPRVDRQGGDPTRVYVLRAVRVEGQECPFNLERDLAALERAITATAARLVVIDPISAYLGERDSYKDSEIRAILTPLADLAERKRVAIVAILHLTKAAQRKLLLRAQGSIAFVAQARVVLAVGEDAEHPGRRYLASVKNNLGPLAPTLAFRLSDAGLTWDPTPIEGTADVLLAQDEAATRTERRERDDAVTFLRDALASGPVSSKQIERDAHANGISRATLWRAKAQLGIKAERSRTTEGNTGPWYWRLPV